MKTLTRIIKIELCQCQVLGDIASEVEIVTIYPKPINATYATVSNLFIKPNQFIFLLAAPGFYISDCGCFYCYDCDHDSSKLKIKIKN